MARCSGTEEYKCTAQAHWKVETETEGVSVCADCMFAWIGEKATVTLLQTEEVELHVPEPACCCCDDDDTMLRENVSKLFGAPGSKLPLDLKVEKLENFQGFGRKRSNDAAFDLYATEDIDISKGDTVAIPCGIKTQFNPGWFMKIEGRSGLALKHGLQPLGGVIDSSYRGEWAVIMHWNWYPPSVNDCPADHVYHIHAGDRIGQAIPVRIDQNGFEFVDSVDENEERGEGGFGSSGK